MGCWSPCAAWPGNESVHSLGWNAALKTRRVGLPRGHLIRGRPAWKCPHVSGRFPGRDECCPLCACFWFRGIFVFPNLFESAHFLPLWPTVLESQSRGSSVFPLVGAGVACPPILSPAPAHGGQTWGPEPPPWHSVV